MAQHGLIAATSQPAGVDKSQTIFLFPIQSDKEGIHKKLMNGPFFSNFEDFSSDSPDLLGHGYN